MGTDMDRELLVEKLQSIVGKDAVFTRAADLLVYEYDDSAVDAAVILVDQKIRGPGENGILTDDALELFDKSFAVHGGP